MRHRRLLLFLALLCWIRYSRPQRPTEDIFRNLFPIQPPHCSKTPIVIAQPSTIANEAVTRSGMQMQFYLGLHTTVCFRLEEGVAIASNHTDHLFQTQSQRPSSWLHTVRLDRLEHHHPVTQRYQFGIPEVRAIASVNATLLLKVVLQSRISTPNALKTPIGTLNQTYTAVKVEQPSTFATFVYTA
ncbi:hypothetical protein COOONC_12309 [Cooperia oncophora]